MLAFLYFLSASCSSTPWFLDYQLYYGRTGPASKQDSLRYIGNVWRFSIKANETFLHLPFINRDTYLMFRIRKHDYKIREAFDSVCMFAYLNNSFDKSTNTSEGAAYLPIELVNYTSSDVFSLEYYINKKVYYEIASRPFFYNKDSNRIQEKMSDTESVIFYSKVRELATAMCSNKEEYLKIFQKYGEEPKTPTFVDKFYVNYRKSKLKSPESKTKYNFDCLLEEMITDFYAVQSKIMEKQKLDKSVSPDASITQLTNILMKYIAKMHVCEGQSTKGFEKALHALPKSPGVARMDKYFQDFTNCINLVYKVNHILHGKEKLIKRIVADMSFATTDEQAPNYSAVLNMGEDKETIYFYERSFKLEVKDNGKNVNVTISGTSFDFENEVIIIMFGTDNAAKLTGSCVTFKLSVPDVGIEISRNVKQDLTDEQEVVPSCSSAGLSLDEVSVESSFLSEADSQKKVCPASATATHDKSSKHLHFASKAKGTYV